MVRVPLFSVVLLGLAVFGQGAGESRAGSIPIPGGSFESPLTLYVSINVDFWQKSAKPDWYVEGGGFLWTQLAGLFKNTPAGSADRIDNLDGNQAAWLFAVREVALFQDYASVDWNDFSPSHAFDAKFEVGKAYTLTVGVIGGGGNMLEGASLEIALYYLDSTTKQVNVAATNIVFSRALFPTTTRFVDIQTRLPIVTPTDPWAGQHIGVRLRSSITDTNLEGGYWDVDNIRLVSVQAPKLQDPRWSGGRFQFTLLSEPGLTFEVLASPNLAAPLTNWTSCGMLTNLTGSTVFGEQVDHVTERFYQVRQLP